MATIKKSNSTDKISGTVIKLSAFLDYQDDSIVSKTLIDKGRSTVTLFSFDKGQGLSEHTVPFDAMVFVADGAAEVTISGKKFVVQEGEMIIMPANKPHSLRAQEKFKMLLTMIRE